MINSRESYERLLEKVDDLLGDVDSRVREAGKVANATTSQLTSVSSDVDDMLAKTKVARATLVRELEKKASLRADKVAAARHMFKVAERLSA